jgi:hypothetical protein
MPIVGYLDHIFFVGIRAMWFVIRVLRVEVGVGWDPELIMVLL